MKKTMFPRSFVIWKDEHTMTIIVRNRVVYDYRGKYYVLDDLYEYWRLEIEPKILKEREAALKKLFIRKEDENK